MFTERPRSLPLPDPSPPQPPVEPGELAALLASGYRTEGEWKPVASAGRLWPLVLHALIPDGECYELLWFDPDRPALRSTEARVSAGVVEECLIQSDVSTAVMERRGSLVVISVDLSRVGAKYGNRGALYSLLEAGAVGHQLAIGAKAMGLGTRMICGFWVSELQQALELELIPLALVLVEHRQ
ncbi:MAG TPA: nitroreductase family protein [Solirubrobacterales bacterium]|nr:nitroreductase family protein [Solirubrobacterales bacterium]